MKENVTPAALAAASVGDMANFIAASTPGGIERQEAQGQLDMIEACRLPRKIMHGDGLTWELLAQKWGMSFKPSDDELFHDVVLPAGWKVVATNHSMNSQLVDQLGRERASVFYKAAFYDRKADLRLRTRYCTQYFSIPEDGGPKSESGYQIIDRGTGAVIETIGTVKHDDWKAEDDLRAAANKRIAELYPDHQDPFAYWDE